MISVIELQLSCKSQTSSLATDPLNSLICENYRKVLLNKVTDLDNWSEVIVSLYVNHFESEHIRFTLSAGVPNHVTLEIISLLRRQLCIDNR